jgi:hypothetical protein
MKKFQRGLFYSFLAGVCAIAVFGSEGFSSRGLRAEEPATYSCADITFGTNEYSSSGAVKTTTFAAHNFTVSGVTPSSAYCLAGNSSTLTSSARIGASGVGGSLTFTFAESRITQNQSLGFEYSDRFSKTAVCQVSTSANATLQSFNVTATSAPNITRCVHDAGLVFTNLDNGGTASTSLTIASTDAARFNLCKIVITIASGTPRGQFFDPEFDHLFGGRQYAPITFNFVEQGNQYSGDCTYIKAGDNDILIDAGNRTSCASTIESYLEDSSRTNNYVSDGKLEYVIATHAHQDHIAGFVGVSDSSRPG